LAASRMNKEAADNTLQATALVHEAWIRLGDPEEQRWDNRAHFFAAAAESMRRILIDRARRKLRPKHGGDLRRTEFEEVEITAGADDEQLLEVNELLDRLAEEEPAKADVVKMKFFIGLSNAETAVAMGISEKTVGRHWRYAKAWLYSEMGGGTDG
jgi:RNA polymerase sigma factor (TIGR02999 family)